MRSLDQFLEQLAQRGSWVGGGSVAALSAALSAALLQKLVHHASTVRQLRAIRRACLELMEQDARTFAQVIEATRRHHRAAFTRTLKSAIEIPCRVFEHAHAVQAACRREQRAVRPQLQSDLRCAMALAMAARESARTLIETNLIWLHDANHTRAIQRRLQRATRTAGR